MLVLSMTLMMTRMILVMVKSELRILIPAVTSYHILALARKSSRISSHIPHISSHCVQHDHQNQQEPWHVLNPAHVHITL